MAEPTPIRARLFPSRVTMPDGTVHDGVLTLIGLDRFWLSKGNKVIGEWMLDDLWGSVKDGMGILTGGQEVKITRGQGCGCGDAAKSGKNPFPIRITMYPLPKQRSVF